MQPVIRFTFSAHRFTVAFIPITSIARGTAIRIARVRVVAGPGTRIICIGRTATRPRTLCVPAADRVRILDTVLVPAAPVITISVEDTERLDTFLTAPERTGVRLRRRLVTGRGTLHVERACKHGNNAHPDDQGDKEIQRETDTGAVHTEKLDVVPT